MRACVVIPTYNEVENIDDVVSRVMEHENIDILVVDDSSPDGTADKVRAWEEKTNGRISLISREKKDGLGGAYLRGFEHCIEQGYDIICEMDADLSHDPAVLPQLIAPISTRQAHFVSGSRYVPGGTIPQWSMIRRMLSRGGNIYARRLLGITVHDATGGYRAYRVDLLRDILRNDIHADGYGFQIEMAYFTDRYKADIAEVPISFTERVHGTSKMSGAIVIEALSLVTWWSIRDRLLRRKKLQTRRYMVSVADTYSGKEVSNNAAQ